MLKSWNLQLRATRRGHSKGSMASSAARGTEGRYEDAEEKAKEKGQGGETEGGKGAL